jgi:4-hydroxy-2-oxoheptanedioate aldolase
MSPPLRDRLDHGERLLGTVITCADPALAELVGARFDLAWIDLEHSALDLRDVPALAIALQAAGCAALVRLPDARFERVAALLDVGVDGIVLPRVESAGAAGRAVARMRHPPHGVRGFAARRAVGYGRAPAGEAAAPVCLVQIESRRAVAGAEAIAAVDGVDGLVVGTADLALDLGAEPDLDAPSMRAALVAVRTATQREGVSFGIAAGSAPEVVARAAGAPPDLVVYAADVRLYAQAVDRIATELAAALGV